MGRLIDSGGSNCLLKCEILHHCLCPAHLKVTVFATYGYVNQYNHTDDSSVWLLEADEEYI